MLKTKDEIDYIKIATTNIAHRKADGVEVLLGFFF